MTTPEQLNAAILATEKPWVVPLQWSIWEGRLGWWRAEVEGLQKAYEIGQDITRAIPGLSYMVDERKTANIVLMGPRRR